jgi:hypothetical protein
MYPAFAADARQQVLTHHLGREFRVSSAGQCGQGLDLGIQRRRCITLLGGYRRGAAAGGTAHQEAQGYEQHAEPRRSIEQVQRR